MVLEKNCHQNNNRFDSNNNRQSKQNVRLQEQTKANALIELTSLLMMMVVVISAEMVRQHWKILQKENCEIFYYDAAQQIEQQVLRKLLK